MLRSPVRLLIIMIAFLCSFIFAIQFNVYYILLVHANQTPQLPGVKITSHMQNQQVPPGILTVTGVSTDNSTSHCNVYIILNEIKPYQRVEPTGDNTTVDDYDYSTWNYTFTPEYATIQEGNNRMVSKITCIEHSSISDENLTKFNSLNVTGIRNADNSINSELGVPSSEPSTNTTISDLLQQQDLESTNANPDSTLSNSNQLQGTNPQNEKQEEGNSNDVSSEIENEQDDSDNKDTDYSSSNKDEDEMEEIGEEFIEELHDRVLDQVTEQLRESGIDLSE